MTIWIGGVGITVSSSKPSYLQNLSKRFWGYINDIPGQIQIEIIETNFKPEITKNGSEYLWFTMFSGHIYVYIENSTWAGKAFISEETPVKYDAIDSMLTMLAAYYLPLFSSVLIHGSCIEYEKSGICFMGESGTGKSTACKIFSPVSKVISEDMLVFNCFVDKITGRSIPLGQKHFWVENDTETKVKNIVFLKKGELRFEEERDRDLILNNILTNQFCRLKPSDRNLMDAIIFNLNRFYKNSKFFNLYWEPERFYQKDREYVSKFKSYVKEISQSYQVNIAQEQIESKIFILNEHILFRESKNQRKIEIWDASSHRRYGITGPAIDIFIYFVQHPTCRIADLVEYGGVLCRQSEVIVNIIEKMLNLGIIRKG